MPIIPRADESQIQSAGSPVAIAGNTSEAALQHNMFGNLGEAMMKVGAKMAQVEDLTTKQATKLEAAIGISRFNTELETLAADIKADPGYLNLSIVDDRGTAEGGKVRSASTPKDSLKAFQERAFAIRDKYAKGATSADMKLLFNSKAEDLISDAGVKFYSSALVDYANVNKMQLEGLISLKASDVFNAKDKKRALEIADSEVQAFVNDAQFLNQAEKNTLGLKSRKDLVEGMLNGYVTEISRNPSSDRRRALTAEALSHFTSLKQTTKTSTIITKDGTEITQTSLLPGVVGTLSVDEQAKMVSAINEAKWKADSRQVQEINMYEALDSKQAKKLQADSFRQYSALMLTAPDDAQEAIIERMRTDAIMGKMDPGKIDDVIKLKNNMFIPTGPISNPADPKYREKFMQKLLGESDPRTLVNEPLLAPDQISAKERISLAETAERFGNAFAKDPSLKSKIQKGVKSFSAYTSDNSYRFLGNESKRALEQAEVMAKQKLFDLVSQNPNIDVNQAAKDIYITDVKPHLEIFKGFSPVVKSNLSELLQQRDSLIGQYVKDKEKGILNKKSELEYKKKLQEINQSIRSTGGE